MKTFEEFWAQIPLSIKATGNRKRIANAAWHESAREYSRHIQKLIGDYMRQPQGLDDLEAGRKRTKYPQGGE